MVNETWNASNPRDTYINGQFKFTSVRWPFIVSHSLQILQKVRQLLSIIFYSLIFNDHDNRCTRKAMNCLWFSTTAISSYVGNPILTPQFIFRFASLADPNLILAQSRHAENSIFVKKKVKFAGLRFPISPTLYRRWLEGRLIGVGLWGNNRDETINSIIALGIPCISFVRAITIDIPSACVDTGVAYHKTGRSRRDWDRNIAGAEL